MAISSAAAASGASEAGSGAEEDDARDEGVFTDANSGPDDDGTVLAETNPQPASDNAESAVGRGDTVQPFLVPAENYPPAGSAAAPIHIDQFDQSYPIDINDSLPPCDWQLDLERIYNSTPSPT